MQCYTGVVKDNKLHLWGQTVYLWMGLKRKMMTVLLLTLIMVTYSLSNKPVIYDEKTLSGSCKGFCSGISPQFNSHGCKTISDCQLNAHGYCDRESGSRCDYCKCICEPEDDARTDFYEVIRNITISEVELYGNCLGNCRKLGLVWTNLKGCQEVRDCYHYRADSGFCEFCICTCRSVNYASGYRLTDVTYDLDSVNTKEQPPQTLAVVCVTNNSSLEQTTTQKFIYTTYSETAVSVSKKLDYGLEFDVRGNANFLGIAQISLGLKLILQSGFSVTTGEKKAETSQKSMTVPLRVSAFTSGKAILEGTSVTIDIPYTGNLVIVYEDGRESQPIPTSGTYKNVNYTRYNVEFKEMTRPCTKTAASTASASVYKSSADQCSVFTSSSSRQLRVHLISTNSVLVYGFFLLFAIVCRHQVGLNTSIRV